jgi:hypothetical protein
MAMVLLATIVYSLFIDYELSSITTFSLARNTVGMQQLTEEYLTQYADEKAASTWDQIHDAHNNLIVLGKSAQKIIDHYDELLNNPEIFDLALFQTEVSEIEGALSSDPSATYDAFVPPPIIENPRSRSLLLVSGLMNLTMDALFESNRNSSFRTYAIR